MDVDYQINDIVQYPSLYLTVGLNDYRGPVWQPAKLLSRLQTIEKNSNIVLFRVDKEGQFSGCEYSQDLIDEYTFIF